MNASPQPNRLDDLLADESVFGLSLEERLELDALLGPEPAKIEAAYEQAAAAYYLAAAPLETETLPDAVKRRALAQATVRHAEVSSDVPAHQAIQRADRSSTLDRWNKAFWVAAVAASLLIGVAVGGRGGVAPTDPRVARDTLVREAANLTRVAWAATDESGAEGEVVWSDQLQEGYMTFRGLAVNDPAAEQYQLWIFDADRDDRYPVDGGVFDIPAGVDEVVTPIKAKIDVRQAVMFAVTIEQPGGVVVSDRSRLPLLAKVE